MLLKLLTSLADASGGHEVGSLYKADNETAKRMLAAGQAERIESAALSPPENAALGRPQPRTRKQG